MISADMDAIEAHSFECLSIKCKQCGQRLRADMATVDAHSLVCQPAVEVVVTACEHTALGGFHAAPLGVSLRCSSEDAAVGRALFDVSLENIAHLSQDPWRRALCSRVAPSSLEN